MNSRVLKQMFPRFCFDWRIVIAALICMALGACGISPDLHPRDIDPAKQELLLPSTTSITTPNNSNP